MTSTRRILRSPLQRAWLFLVLLTLCAITACSGSALSPAAVKAANDALDGGTGTSSANSGGSVGTGTGTGTGTPGSSNVPAGSSNSGPSGSGTTGGATTGGNTGGTGGTPPATAGLAAGSCAGFQNGPGITSTTITIGNSSDVTGPVLGLFAAAQQGVKAYVAYFNATSNICGRKLKLLTQDSQTSASGDQVGYQNICAQAFAGVGSMAVYDSGGAQIAQGCGLPDIRTAITTDARAACTTCFAAQGGNAAYYENAPFTYFFNKIPGIKSHVAIAFINGGGGAENAATMHSVAQKLGATNVDMEAFGISDLSYDSYVQSMKSKNVQYVIFLGPYQDTVKLQQSFKTNGFAPKVFVQDPTIYDPNYVSQANSAGVGNGTYVYSNFLPFSLASTNREMSTYMAWLQQAAPGANPTFYGVFAWSAAALFVREAIQLGGKLNRASLANALRGVHNWTDNGMTAPQDVGAKVNGSCWRFLQLQSGRWNNVAGYQCDGITHK